MSQRPQRSRVALKPVAVNDADQEVALDELALLLRGFPGAPGGEPVEVAVAEVLGSVLGGEGVEVEYTWRRE